MAQVLVSNDDAILRSQGHESQLHRSFSTISALSLAFSITNSWAGYSASIAIPTLAGGGPGIVYCLLVSFVANMVITLGVAELASAFPSSGGQYHFTFMVAPLKSRAFFAFFSGWFSTLGWALTATSAVIIVASTTTSLIFFATDGAWQLAAWQTYLIYSGLLLLSTAFPLFTPRALPRIEQFFFYNSILACICGFVVMLAASDQKQDAEVVFAKYDNQLGWSDGFSFMIGLGQAMFAFLGTDAVTHLSEEIKNPGRHVPRVMCLTVIIGLATALPYSLAMLFSSTDMAAVSQSPTPVMTSFYQATGSKWGTICYMSWMILNYFGAGIGCITTSGRLAWAFARDMGLPYSSIFLQVNSRQQVPVNSTLLVMVFCLLYGLIYIGSTTAFNSFITMAILALNMSYALPQFLVLLQGRKHVLPQRQFDLGPVFGPLVNIFSCVWVSFFIVIFCFPYFKDVQVENMNYSSVVTAGITLLVSGLWILKKRKDFTGPNISLEGVEESHDVASCDQEEKA